MYDLAFNINFIFHASNSLLHFSIILANLKPGMKILMIDDDPALITVISTALNTENYQVITANDGRTGLNLAQTEKPDFILLDQVLPDIQGNEVLATLKQNADTKNIPVVIFSNFYKPELMQQAINQGAVDYLLKYQIEPKDLLNKIKSLTQESKAEQAQG